MGYDSATYHDLSLSAHEVPDSRPAPGLCPECEKVTSPLLVIGIQRWATCAEHKTAWHVFNSRIFSCGTAAPEWAVNRERLNQYTIVEPKPCDFGTLDHWLRVAMGERSYHPLSGQTSPESPMASTEEPPKSPVTLAPITVRHLAYHITPFVSNDVWLRNVRQLLKRIDQFNGNRVVAIVTGPKFVSPVDVMREMDGHGIEFVTMPNDTWLRERVSAEALFERVESTAENEAVFYAHAKGVATAGDTRGVTFWRNAMYHELLDTPEKIGDLLTRHPTVGTHRIRGCSSYPDGLKGSWHFAGTYWWFRNDTFFSQPWREKIPKSGWGMEALPGLMFRYEDSCCVFMDDPRNPYDPKLYEEPIEDDEPELARSDALKIEIGGGEKPRKDGYINIDRLPCADIQLDFDAPDMRLPFDDDSVLDVYSSHCLEHVHNLGALLREIVRVCRIGARVEIIVPHWLSNSAMCHGHVQTIGHEQVDHWARSALDYWWGGMRKHLKLFHAEHRRGGAFDRWKRMLPNATDQDILELCPDACHEVVYAFHVVGRQ